MKINFLMDKFCEYISYMKGYGEVTVDRYRKVVGFFCAHAQISEIEEVNDKNTKDYFFNGRTTRQWGANTFVTYHKTLAVFFRWCQEHKFMPCNPMDDIELPKIPKRLPPKLTRQEAFRLLEVVYNYPYRLRYQRYRNHAVLAMFIFTGIRKKELLKLRYADVDLQNLSLFINQGKGSKDRVIPICSTLAETLDKYIIERKKLNKTCPEFFTSLRRNAGFTDSALKRLTVAFNQCSGIKFTIHRLRHTFATLMLEGGCDIFSLSKMMGHSDIKTTTIYLAASADHLRGQMMKHPLNGI